MNVPATFVFSLNSDEFVPQISIDHAVLEADKNNEPVFYNKLAFDHPDYDISLSTPGNEYLNKVHRLATAVYKNCLIFMQCDQETNWEGADSVYDTWLLSNNTPRKWFPYKKFINIKITYIQQREFRTVFAINTNKRGEV